MIRHRRLKEVIYFMRINKYIKLDHGVSSATPVVLKHDYWDKLGRGQFDMHYEVELGIVVSGKMIRKHAEWEHLFTEGDVWCNSIWEPHGTEITGIPIELLMFHIYPPTLAQMHFPEFDRINWLSLFTRPIEQRVTSLSKNPDLSLKIAKSAIDLLKKQKQAPFLLYNLKVRQLMMELLIAVAEENPVNLNTEFTSHSDYQKINKAIELVFSSNRLITFEEAVKVSGINRTQFAQTFKEFMGMSFAKFALRYRLEGAADDLRYTAMAVKEIAGKWGFTDSSHFHRHFVRNYHATPEVFRKFK